MIWNGNQREKKGNDNMKRLAILSVTMIFATSSIAAAQLSFAETNADTTTNRTTQSYDSKSVKTKTASVQKDTSWFEYYDLKDTYEISSEEELLGFASLINENQTDSWKPNRIENFEGVTFVLTDDIKLTTSEWDSDRQRQRFIFCRSVRRQRTYDQRSQGRQRFRPCRIFWISQGRGKRSYRGRYREIR